MNSTCYAYNINRDIDNSRTIHYKVNQFINQGNNRLCIVEGATDRLFYSNLSNYNIPYKYIYSTDRRGLIGKEAVINSMYSIFGDDKLKNRINKCVFIIDHDYLGAVTEENRYNSSIQERFSITKPYSFENYFLTEENLKKIFDYYNLNDCDKFIKIYNEFFEEIKEFIRYKYTQVRVDMEENIKYKCTYDNIDIFEFSFSNGTYEFDKPKMIAEIISLKRHINNYPIAKKIYEEDSKEFVENNTYIKGHDAFYFLQKYLYDIHDIYLDEYCEDYKELVKILDIDMDIKDVYGRSLKKR